MKFNKQHIKSIRQSYKNIFLLFCVSSGSIFAEDDENFINYEDRVQSCNFHEYPFLIYKNKSSVLDADMMDIKSNGAMYLNGDVFIGLSEGRINADSATYLQKLNICAFSLIDRKDMTLLKCDLTQLRFHN